MARRAPRSARPSPASPRRARASGLRALTLGLAAAAAGCASAEVLLPLDLSEAPSGVGFMVVLGPDRAVRAVEGPFGIEDGALSFGARPQVRLPEGGGAIALVVPLDALVAAVPGFTAGDLPSVRLGPTAPAAPALLTSGRVEQEVPRPDDTRYWRGDAATAARAVGPAEVADDLAALKLTAAYDPESCRPPGTGVLTPYGGVSEPLGELGAPPFFGSLRDVVIVDDILDSGRTLHFAKALLALGFESSGMFLFTRGRPLTRADHAGPPPRAVFSVLDLLGPQPGSADIEAVAIDPTSPLDARRVAVVATASDRAVDPEVVTSALLWMSLTQDGLTLVRTGTVTTGPRLRDVSFAPDGRWMLTADRGVAYFGAPGAEVPVPGRYAEPIAAEARRGTWTPDPERPWVITARSALYTYFETIQRWVAQPVRGQVDENLYFIGLAAADVGGRTEVWTGGAGGLLYASRGGGEFEFVSPATPPRLGGCTQQPGEARPLYVQDVSDVAIDGERVFLLPDDCTAIMQVRLTDGCSSLLTLEGLEVLAANRVLRGLDLRDGRLVAVGRDGKVWEARLE